MSDSVREKILENIRTTIATVTIANGYVNTLASVQRWKQIGNSCKDIPCVVIVEDSENKKPVPNPNFSCILPVDILIYTRQEESDTRSTGTLLNSLLADVEKVLMVDVTRGGYAHDTNITGNDPFPTVPGEPAAGIILNIEIEYQHTQTDPTVAG
jgi:hypothetical protein